MSLKERKGNYAETGEDISGGDGLAERKKSKDMGGRRMPERRSRSRSRGSTLAFRAETKGDQVILTFGKMPEDPVQISFAQGAWYQINLFNSAGIPAIPFQVKV